jgi:phenylalanyl-tRNA synthetase beta chain
VYAPSGPLNGVTEGSPAGAMPALERHHLAMLHTQAVPAGWGGTGVAASFFTARALLEAVLTVANIAWAPKAEAQPFLHPGRAASVTVDDRKIGWVGEVHPKVAAEWGMAWPLAGFEIDIDAVVELGAGREPVYQDVTSFPPVLEDIAVVLPADVPAASVVAAVRDGGGDLLASVEVFDVYSGEQVGEGQKSLALRLSFQAPDRTLTDAEVAERRAAIESALDEIGGRLRA